MNIGRTRHREVVLGHEDERVDEIGKHMRGTGKFGPSATLLAAVQDMRAREEAGPEPGETLREALAEIGISDWTDPETGDPAEENVPRLEEH